MTTLVAYEPFVHAPLAVAPTAEPLLLRALRREPVERPPVWLMRQAGRYLPEFRAVRARADFLTMVRTPDLAVEVTLQPVRRYGVDAAIVFSDILVIPDAMGMRLTVEESVGPVLHDPVRSMADVRRLLPVDPAADLAYHLTTLRETRRALDPGTALIGFAGAPWTLAAYMLEGSGGRQFAVAKRMLTERPDVAHALLARLADAVGDFLVAQVAAGAQAVQLFDSWAGALGPDDFARFALPYLARAARRAAEAGAPVIVFAPGAWMHAEAIAAATQPAALGADWHVRPDEARRLADRMRVAVQGNLDPCHLYGDAATVRRRTRAMLRGLHGAGHVANLGHGVLPDTPVENVGAFIETVQQWRADACEEE
ncbi:uroporphyrinogen decarboxylase [Roseisolibacter sp. H3M3-2]|uniref:uroporphyrinogen decarboxylase n=1 Tax=Roseisolibacter sp. H3M3-2 TaxID=3031323 RepID=UPI0023DB3963|nr:uroporphyrinogen decarboxylase [Roseisolibacter sp. H3M3-2]MDF1501842.1 uroporphyrinogen decarboxylase [Roseisolibacter sp. H3M3-2]